MSKFKRKDEEKKCLRCQETKAINMFRKKRRTKDGYNWLCIKCENKHNEQRSLNNKKIKKCPKCEKTKSLNEFYEKNVEVDQKDWCCLCVGKWLFENKKQKKCTRCEIEKPINQFQKNNWGQNGYSDCCKQCGMTYKL